MWCAQSLKTTKKQKMLFSGSEGSMGYSLPAAIGAYYATKKKVICFCGDGGFQMNIQELQFLDREHLPIDIVLFNNQSLGMIRHFQEIYFKENYFHTINKKGYSAPIFKKVVEAYNIKYKRLTFKNVNRIKMFDSTSTLYEIIMNNKTYVKRCGKIEDIIRIK